MDSSGSNKNNSNVVDGVKSNHNALWRGHHLVPQFWHRSRSNLGVRQRRRSLVQRRRSFGDASNFKAVPHCQLQDDDTAFADRGFDSDDPEQAQEYFYMLNDTNNYHEKRSRGRWGLKMGKSNRNNQDYVDRTYRNDEPQHLQQQQRHHHQQQQQNEQATHNPLLQEQPHRLSQQMQLNPQVQQMPLSAAATPAGSIILDDWRNPALSSHLRAYTASSSGNTSSGGGRVSSRLMCVPSAEAAMPVFRREDDSKRYQSVSSTSTTSMQVGLNDAATTSSNHSGLFARKRHMMVPKEPSPGLRRTMSCLAMIPSGSTDVSSFGAHSLAIPMIASEPTTTNTSNDEKKKKKKKKEKKKKKKKAAEPKVFTDSDDESGYSSANGDSSTIAAPVLQFLVSSSSSQNADHVFVLENARAFSNELNNKSLDDMDITPRSEHNNSNHSTRNDDLEKQPKQWSDSTASTTRNSSANPAMTVPQDHGDFSAQVADATERSGALTIIPSPSPVWMPDANHAAFRADESLQESGGVPVLEGQAPQEKAKETNPDSASGAGAVDKFEKNVISLSDHLDRASKSKTTSQMSRSLPNNSGGSSRGRHSDLSYVPGGGPASAANIRPGVQLPGEYFRSYAFQEDSDAVKPKIRRRDQLDDCRSAATASGSRSSVASRTSIASVLSMVDTHSVFSVGGNSLSSSHASVVTRSSVGSTQSAPAAPPNQWDVDRQLKKSVSQRSIETDTDFFKLTSPAVSHSDIVTTSTTTSIALPHRGKNSNIINTDEEVWMDDAKGVPHKVSISFRRLTLRSNMRDLKERIHVEHALATTSSTVLPQTSSSVNNNHAPPRPPLLTPPTSNLSTTSAFANVIKGLAEQPSSFQDEVAMGELGSGVDEEKKKKKKKKAKTKK